MATDLKPKQYVLLTPEFVKRLRLFVGSASQSESKLGLKTRTLNGWIAKAKKQPGFNARLALVAAVFQAMTDDGEPCTRDNSGLGEEACELINCTLNRSVAKWSPDQDDAGVGAHATQMPPEQLSQSQLPSGQQQTPQLPLAQVPSKQLRSILQDNKEYSNAIFALRGWLSSASEGQYINGIDYGLTHTDRVVRNLNILASPLLAKDELDDDDAFLLIASAYLHDFAYFFFTEQEDSDSVSNELHKQHAERMALVVSRFANDEIPEPLLKSIETVAENRPPEIQRIREVFVKFSRQLSTFVRFHDLTDDAFQIASAFNEERRDPDPGLYWESRRAKLTAMVAIFQLADALDFHCHRVDGKMLFKIKRKDVAALTPMEQSNLARMAMYDSYAQPKIEIDHMMRRIIVTLRPRFDDNAIGNRFLENCSSYVNGKTKKSHNSLLLEIEKFTNYSLSYIEESETDGFLRLDSGEAMRLAKWAVNVEREAVVSVDAVLDDLLAISGGQLTWVKIYHPRGFLYGGRAYAHPDLSDGIPFIERTVFEPNAWGFTDLKQVYAFENASDVYKTFSKNSKDVKQFRYYSTATEGVASEMYVVLYAPRDESSSGGFDPVLCVNVHFVKKFDQKALTELGHGIAQRSAELTDAYLEASRKQADEAIKFFEDPLHCTTDFRDEIVMLLRDMRDRNCNGELFDFHELKASVPRFDYCKETRDGRQKKKRRGADGSSTPTCRGFVANKKLLVDLVVRLDQMLDGHGVFRFSYGESYGVPLVNFTIRVPQTKNAAQRTLKCVNGVSTYSEMFERLEPILTSPDLSSSQLCECIEKSHGNWRRMLMIALEVRVMIEASGGKISVVGKESAFKRQLGFRFEFPSAGVLSQIS